MVLLLLVVAKIIPGTQAVGVKDRRSSSHGVLEVVKVENPGDLLLLVKETGVLQLLVIKEALLPQQQIGQIVVIALKEGHHLHPHRGEQLLVVKEKPGPPRGRESLNLLHHHGRIIRREVVEKEETITEKELLAEVAAKASMGKTTSTTMHMLIMLPPATPAKIMVGIKKMSLLRSY